MSGTGKILVAAGLLLAAVGGALWLLDGRAGWFGHLPGDIRVDKPNFRFYFPVTTMLLVSAVINLLLWLARRFHR